MKSPKPPAAPKPADVSAAQTESNTDTAAYENALAHGNVTTPFGSQTFTPRVDPTTGATMYDQNVSLSPDQQQLYDQQTQQDLALGGVSGSMLDQVKDAYAKSFDSSGQPALRGNIDTSNLPKLYGADDLEGARRDVSDALYRRQAAYLDPQYQQRDASMRTRLANQGITEGSEAWKNSIDEFDRGRSFDYGQARDSSIAGGLAEMQGLSGIAAQNRGQMYGENVTGAGFQNQARTQGMNEALAERALPLNEYNSLRTASQIDVPQFQNPGTPNIQPTDTSGNEWNAYNSALNIWNTQAGQNGNFLSGLMNLGGQLGSSYINRPVATSDERVKDEIEPVGALSPDIGLYEYEYAGDPLHERHTGVMAQEVEQVDPDAVLTGPDGVKRVDYSRVLAAALLKRAA